jgi:hypothetical protein
LAVGHLQIIPPPHSEARSEAKISLALT